MHKATPRYTFLAFALMVSVVNLIAQADTIQRDTFSYPSVNTSYIIPACTCRVEPITHRDDTVTAVQPLHCTEIDFDSTLNCTWVIFYEDSHSVYHYITVHNGRVREISYPNANPGPYTLTFRGNKQVSRSYYSNGRLMDISRAHLKKNNSTSWGYWKDGQKSYHLKYKNGQLVHEEYWGLDGKPISHDEYLKIEREQWTH